MNEARMSMCVLGSGSAGNSTVIALHEEDEGGGARHMLVDLGLSPRQTNQRMSTLGLSVRDVSDALITHLDWDHLNPGWPAQLRKLEIRVHVHESHFKDALAAGVPAERLVIHEGGIEFGTGSAVRAMRLAHDEEGSVGFVIEHGGARIGFATDLGCVPRELMALFSSLDALAMESNYDRRMQIASARPAYLKQRIMGGKGHLSNDEALEAVREIAARSALQHVVLLHLSRECNSPRVVQRMYAEHAPELLDRLTITSQHSPTGLLRVKRGQRQDGSELAEMRVEGGYQMRMFE